MFVALVLMALKTHITDNIEKTTVVKTTRVAYISALKGLSFTLTVYSYNKPGFGIRSLEVPKSAP